MQPKDAHLSQRDATLGGDAARIEPYIASGEGVLEAAMRRAQSTGKRDSFAGQTSWAARRICREE